MTELLNAISFILSKLGVLTPVNIVLVSVIVTVSYCLYKVVEGVFCRLAKVIDENTASNTKISDAMREIAKSTDMMGLTLNNVNTSITENRIVLEACKDRR